MKTYRCAVLSVVKHAYMPRGVASHPQFELVVVADDADQPDWVHARNQKFADEFHIPYVHDVRQALADYDVQVAVVSPEAERHCELSVRAAEAGLHIVQDKPMSNRLSECERLVAAVERSGMKFLLWNRNFLPALVDAHARVAAGAVGTLRSIHVDFYFSKDAGPAKGTSQPGDPPLDWLAHQIAAHVDGSDGGLGHEPLGELKIEGIYPLAYMQLLTGGVPVRRVFARTAAHFHQLNADHQVDDLATVSLEFDNGMLGSLCIGRIGAASHPEIGEIKLHLIGDKGALIVNEARPEVGVFYRDQPPLEHRYRRLAIDNDFQLMQNFVQAIEQGHETILNARASRDIAAIVEAALASSQSGQPVDVAYR